MEVRAWSSQCLGATEVMYLLEFRRQNKPELPLLMLSQTSSCVCLPCFIVFHLGKAPVESPSVGAHQPEQPPELANGGKPILPDQVAPAAADTESQSLGFDAANRTVSPQHAVDELEAAMRDSSIEDFETVVSKALLNCDFADAQQAIDSVTDTTDRMGFLEAAAKEGGTWYMRGKVGSMWSNALRADATLKNKYNLECVGKQQKQKFRHEWVSCLEHGFAYCSIRVCFVFYL